MRSVSIAVAIAAAMTVTGAAAASELLTGRNGMTLYTFAEDTPGRSACSWHCIRIWPPASETDATGPDFGAITREGGMRQLTYRGKPLYYFIGDRRPGEANGAGVDQAWHVVVIGRPESAAAPATPPPGSVAIENRRYAMTDGETVYRAAVGALRSTGRIERLYHPAYEKRVRRPSQEE